MMEYDVYHDESQEVGYWHGILLVPRKRRDNLLENLQVFRKEESYDATLNFKGLKKKGRRFGCTRMWIELGSIALMQRLRQEETIYNAKPVYSKHEGRKAIKYKELIKINEAIRARFILFKERDGHMTMNTQWFSDYAAKVETTFRIGLKGGLHFLFNESEQAVIKSIHFHGYEHHQRPLDRDRVIGRFKEGLRPYCSIDKNLVLDTRTGDHSKSDSQNYDDCQFLQLTDLMVGAFRTILGEVKNPVQKEVSYPVERIVHRWNKGAARMKNSRWFGGVCISECYLENGKWNFENIIVRDDMRNKQLRLDYSEK